MNKFLLAIVFCLALITPIFSQIWTSCGTSSDKFQITDVTLTPAVPVKGQLLTVEASGVLSETVTAGDAKILIKYGFITLFNKVEDICSSQDPIPCPIQAGQYSKTINATIPAAAPSGKYTGNVVITDQNNAEIACINVNIDL